MVNDRPPTVHPCEDSDAEATVKTPNEATLLYATSGGEPTAAVASRLQREDDLQVRATGSVAGARAQLSAADPRVDCVLSGHDPPDLDVLEVIDAVSDHESDAPVIVATVNGDERLASRALSAGARGYVPLQPAAPERDRDPTEYTPGEPRFDGLLDQIRSAVRRHRSRSGLELYRSLTEDAVAAANVGILIRDATGEVVWINRTVERYLGVPGDRLLDRQFGDVVDDDLADVLADPEAFETAVRCREAIEDYECRVLPAADREERFLEYHERAIASGAFAGGRIGLFYDVTDRRERERELERYERMVELVADGVYTLDAEYDYTFVNEAMTEITGYSRDEIVGSSASMLVGEETIRAAYERREELLDHPDRVMTAEYEMYTADGDAVPIEVRFRPLPFDDEFRGTVGVIRDVSERKRRERELRRQNERLDEFASVVSHDLREPLRTVRNYLELLERRYGDQLGEDAEDFIEFAVDGADRMQAIIEDVLALARKGKIVGDTEPLDLARVARSAWENVETRRATLTVADDVGTVEAHDSRLVGVFENLFANAVEHGGADVEVTVGALETGFFVADDGPGIPEGKREAVLEYRHTTEPDNTGFGLAIVKEIVEAHGWRIDVTEGAEGGARFEIVTENGH
jgi:PAS domain S-box-containing protein